MKDFTTKYIEYKSGYKYQLCTTYKCRVGILPPKNIYTRYINLTIKGLLTIKGGYAWDGSSGPTFDSPHCMRASLIHDALAQLLRMKQLDIKWLEQADLEYKITCLADGMSRLQAWWRWKALQGVDSYAKPKNKRPVEYAPFNPTEL